MIGQSLDEHDYAGKARKYAEDVVAGRAPVCEWVRLASERHLRDLNRQSTEAFPWRFDDRPWDDKNDPAGHEIGGRANRVCRFIEKLPHIKGRWPTRNIVLEPWQCFMLCCIFGWVDGDGMRRFRNALIVIPRKQGKTLIAAAVALYLLVLDHEPGAEVYSAATTRDQARICWTLAEKMVERSPEFRDRYSISALAHSIAVESDAAFFKPLSRDANTLEGLNPHGVIIDELHAHKTREVFDVMDEAEGARSQPLKFIISTEGDQQVGVFVDQVAYLQQILLGNHEDETYFGMFFGIDETDDWTTEAAWAKANPNLYVLDARGVPTLLHSMESRIRRAKRDPASQASFKTKRLNIRAGAAAAYFNLLAWQQLCKDESLRMEDFRGLDCVATIDLASKSDLATKVVVFRGTESKGRIGDYYVFGKYYLPEDAVQVGAPNYDFYRGWVEREFLTTNKGPRIDYGFLEEETKRFAAQYQPQSIGVDPAYNGEHFRQHMEDAGVLVVEIPHSVLRFSEPMKELAALILAGRIHHNGDPILAWAIGNVVAKEDAKGNVYPRKARPESKIDPAVMLIANLSEQLRFESPYADVSVSSVSA